MNNIYILGAGGMARETYQIYVDNNEQNKVKGFIINYDTDKHSKVDLYGLPIMRISHNAINGLLVAGIGTPKRSNWIEKLEKNNSEFDILIHSHSSVGINTTIGTGSIICRQVSITCDVEIGRHTIVNINSSIHHDSKIGNFVTIGPGTTIAGNVVIGNGTFIGAGVTIIQNVKIGANAYVGAGSIVIDDIPDNYLAYGCPAKPIRKLRREDWDKII